MRAHPLFTAFVAAAAVRAQAAGDRSEDAKPSKLTVHRTALQA
jgi:hypothetical protein